jgi:hypothetical protein
MNLLWLPLASRRGWDRARVPRILQPHLLDTQHVEHPTPPEGQKVRVIGLPGLVARHVLVRTVAGVGHIFTTGAVALDTDTRGVDIHRSENATADSFSKTSCLHRLDDEPGRVSQGSRGWGSAVRGVPRTASRGDYFVCAHG